MTVPTNMAGNPQGRGKVALDMCRAIKAACGPDFLIDLWIAGQEEDPGGITAADTVAFAKCAEGLVDILQIRGGQHQSRPPHWV